MLREYQTLAVDDAIKWIKSTLEPGLIEAYTAAGKSLIVAEIARIVTGMTGKKVLVLQPNKELLTQNVAKYKLTGNPCSVFSASAGQKSVRHNVVYGTALTVKNMLSAFCSKFCLVILDEADASLTPTILSIIAHMREQNPQLRVLGLTSSPYKLGYGYIYKMDINNKPVPEDQTRDAYFTKQIVHISGRYLLDNGYVSPITIGAINEGYDTSGLEVNNMGKFTSASVDRAFVGLGRKTSRIIEDIIYQSRGRKSVLIFSATQQHAIECMQSLPPHLSAMVTDKTPAIEREKIVRDFTDCKIKYLVNVTIFTRGTDFPKLDVIALLRATESSALLHQILGRGVRIAEGKEDCLLLDYASNVDTHFPDHDLFSPQIKASKGKSSDTTITAVCEYCNTENEFSARPNEDGFDIDVNGYYVDLNGLRIMTEHGAIPAHYGRRCMALLRQPDGSFPQCDYYWTSKECPNDKCKEPNDISARYCRVCKTEIIDPNDKLIADFKARKKDPYSMQCDKVLSWSFKKTLSGKGNEVLKVDFVTEHRSFAIWYHVRSAEPWIIKKYEALIRSTKGLEKMPDTITYRKQDTGFFEVFAYNQPHDELENAA